MVQSIVGLDIGGTAVRAAEVSGERKGKQTLLRYHEVLLPEGAVSRGEVREPNTVSAALRRLWSEGGFKSRNVVLGVGNQRVLARDLSVPKMSAIRIRESLPFQVQDMLPVPVTEAVLDFYPVSEVMGEHGPTVKGLLVAAVKDLVLGNVRAVEQAGLTAVGVDLIPFALSRVLINRPQLAGTVALVDVGATATSVLIAAEGVPQFVRIIPAGGEDVTQALTSGLDVERAEAEQVKRRLSLTAVIRDDADQGATEILHAVTGELINSVRNTVNYYINTRPSETVRQILLSGGGAQLSGFARMLADATHLSVVVADPFHAVTKPHAGKEKGPRPGYAAIAVALGLALRRVS